MNLLVPALPGQDAATAKWLTAVKTADGRQVRIEHVDGKKQSGTLVRGSETGFVLVLGKADVAIDRGTVRKIQLRRGRSRGKRALIGLGIGAASGAGLGAIAAEYDRSEYAILNVPAFAILGACIGAIAGAVLPNRYATLYTVPVRTQP